MIAIGVTFLASGLMFLPLIAVLIATTQPKQADRLLTAPPLPPAREELSEPWPERQSSTDLAVAYAAPPVLPPPIIPGGPWQSPPNPELAYVHAHMPAVAPAADYRPRHARDAGSVTMEFARIVGTEYPGVEITHIGHGNHAGRAMLGEST